MSYLPERTASANSFEWAITKPAFLKQNGLYVHIPFCIRKCEYCDFYSITQFDQVDEFVLALQKEMELAAPALKEKLFTTVFFGGGTPSLLSTQQLSDIWQTMNRCFQIKPDAQITIEANPGDLGYDKLAFLRDLGFNRLSMGVQSFVEAELKFLGRIHSVSDVEENITYARKAGFDSLNIDLMTSFPGITPDSFQHSLNKALSFNTEHLSCYTLIFEPGTILYKRMKKGEVSPLANEEEASYYEMARETLEAHGYRQYEISNFAREEAYVCRHNLLYWQHEPYFGFGPSAHSFDGVNRYSNKRSVMAYIKDIAAGRFSRDLDEKLSEKELMFETIFLGLRLRSGIYLKRFEERFGRRLEDVYPKPLAKLKAQGLIEQKDGCLRLTTDGWLMADAIAAKFD